MGNTGTTTTTTTILNEPEPTLSNIAAMSFSNVESLTTDTTTTLTNVEPPTPDNTTPTNVEPSIPDPFFAAMARHPLATWDGKILNRIRRAIVMKATAILTTQLTTYGSEPMQKTR